MPTLTEQERYEQARRRVAQIKDFYAHLSVYALVNLGLFAIDSLTPGETWFHWPLMGWGLGVLAHWAGVFGAPRRFGAEWEQRKIRELMEHDTGR